jgi:hypothetical protein
MTMAMTNTSTASRLRALGRHIQASGAAGGKREERQEEPGGFLSGVPPYFVKSGLEAFRAARMQESDVVMVSYPKCGTSWLHQVLFCLLRMDDTGQFAGDVEAILGSKGQVYPDGIEAEGEGQEGKFSGATVADLLGQPVRAPLAPLTQLRGPLRYTAASHRCLSLSLPHSLWAVSSLRQAPRLITTHIRAGNLPPSLTGRHDPSASAALAAGANTAPPPPGRGRLVVSAPQRSAIII